MNQIRIRLKALRLEMLKNNLDAYYISGTDPHMSEYLPDRWQTRKFITGFTGSYGITVVTNEEAGLWTDSRYFIQAKKQLMGSEIKMFKLRVPNAVLPEQWLPQKLPEGSRVGFNPETLSMQSFRRLKNELDKVNIHLVESSDLLDKIWEERPLIPENKVTELSLKYSGRSRNDKIGSVSNALKKEAADILIISALDELAWLFNLRGTDIMYNPVFIGFGAVTETEALLFIEKDKISDNVSQKLENKQVRIKNYNQFYSWLNSLKNKTLYIDPAITNYTIFKSVNIENTVIEGPSIVSKLKAVKNETELKVWKEAMKKDGVALVEFLFWLKNSVSKDEITEYSAGIKLNEIRSKQKDFQGQSFAPIVGYQSNGAIIHYSALQENCLKLKEEGILLFDSGGHYLQGTTDITRTISLGKPTEKQKNDFTLVLKGMIALTKAKFPEGTKGCNIDILARKSLWDNGLNYGHGTGHGVGFFLNVHEGPMSIRQEYNSVSLKPGMVVSNEPGMYREGEYGIRIENLIVCVEKEKTEFGNFLGFETLTLCPIDTSLINTDMLTKEEKGWLNDYHNLVEQELKPLLPDELKSFLEELVTNRA